MKQRACLGIILYVIVAVVYAGGSAYAGSTNGYLKKGNRYYNEEKYEEAVKIYNEALLKDPNDPIVQYNRAAAFYRKKDFENAESSFLNVLASGEEDLEADAMYNTGNTKYREAESVQENDAQAATETYNEALKFYKSAMELVPENKEAKYNYEFTMKKIEELKAQQQQQDQRQKEREDKKDKEEDKDGQGTKGKDQKDREKEDQRQKEREDKEDKEDKEEDQEDQGSKGKGQKDREEDQDQREEKKGQGAPTEKDQSELEGDIGREERPEGGMTKEAAEMLLRGQEEEEMRMRQDNKKKAGANRPIVIRDW
ncbi:MAG: tetratricopeptide repeat protein [Candidatus Omnitrophica bacterium]|nr:tetratricopeptide repeat protein [Candidatus Omnitrophota bacterium]